MEHRNDSDEPEEEQLKQEPEQEPAQEPEETLGASSGGGEATTRHIAKNFFAKPVLLTIPPKIAAFYRLLRRMELSNKFLSPTCGPAHGDIATYFFFEKIFRSDGEICVSVT